jgi:hypothetical protein
LKAFAFDDRFERKDAHYLLYYIEHAAGGIDAAAEWEARALRQHEVSDLISSYCCGQTEPPHPAGCCSTSVA